MKTTLEIPDDLFRAAKARAALDGRKLKDVVADGLRAVVNKPAAKGPRHVKFPLIAAKGSRKLKIPDDAASRIVLLDDLEP